MYLKLKQQRARKDARGLEESENSLQAPRVHDTPRDIAEISEHGHRSNPSWFRPCRWSMFLFHAACHLRRSVR